MIVTIQDNEDVYTRLIKPSHSSNIGSPHSARSRSPHSSGIGSPHSAGIGSPHSAGIGSPHSAGIGSPHSAGIGSPHSTGIGSPHSAGIRYPRSPGVGSPLFISSHSPTSSPANNFAVPLSPEVFSCEEDEDPYSLPEESPILPSDHRDRAVSAPNDSTLKADGKSYYDLNFSTATVFNAKHSITTYHFVLGLYSILRITPIELQGRDL